MSLLAQDSDLAIRLMADDPADYSALSMWLSNPAVLEFYEGRDNPISIEIAREKYSPQLLGSENVTAYMLLQRDTPIGYLQHYPFTEQIIASFGLQPFANYHSLGIDTFIGEPHLWNQGLGSRAANLFVAYLFACKDAERIFVDPHVSNARAIRCYEKCGFKKLKMLPQHELHEGTYRDAWLMERLSPAAGATSATF